MVADYYLVGCIANNVNLLEPICIASGTAQILGNLDGGRRFVWRHYASGPILDSDKHHFSVAAQGGL
jgi:hypothetical protein